MYTEFFGLNEKPFAITPDPRYLYMSARHTDALAHLVYGMSESGGFIQLTGEVGTGKTTLIRSLLEQLPEKADIALILSPQLTTLEFLQTIAEELGCPLPQERTVKALIDACQLQRRGHVLRIGLAAKVLVNRLVVHGDRTSATGMQTHARRRGLAPSDTFVILI